MKNIPNERSISKKSKYFLPLKELGMSSASCEWFSFGYVDGDGEDEIIGYCAKGYWFAWKKAHEQVFRFGKAPYCLTQMVVGDFWGDGKIFLLLDRKSTRLNSSHSSISYALFFFKK